MKAKDTILEGWVLTDTAEILYNFRETMNIIGIKSILWQQANHQAKISFQAGIKEVVGFLTLYVPERPNAGKIRIAMDCDLWKSKLKEWGIDES